jgi:hypothetical protein
MKKENIVSISAGNRKMGAIPSVSLPPVVTCAAGCKCAAKCYAAKLCRIYPTVRDAYARNLEIYRSSPAEYFAQVKAAAATTKFFRWHVSGDILNDVYFVRMVHAARDLPGTMFLAFTKKYDIVNRYIEKFGPLPDNLKIIFSAWPGMEMENPHALPVANVIFRGEKPADGWKICGGNCAACACAGVGCWELKNGETIAIFEH